MIAEANYNTAEKRERIMELAFEKLEAPAAFLCKSAVLAAFAMGKATALVLDGGGGSSSAVPVHDGFVLQKGLQRTVVGGDMISRQVERLIFQQNGLEVPSRYSLERKVVGLGQVISTPRSLPNTTVSYDLFMKRQVARDVKESICRVSEAEFLSQHNANIPTEKFELPDGKILDIGPERFAVAEFLFRPTPEFREQMGRDFADAPTFNGLHHMVSQSIDQCDVDVRKELYSNIVLTGAGTLFPGFSGRLANELSRDLPPAFRVKVLTPPTNIERRFGTWIGGSILGSLGSFHQMWFSKAEYEEHGSALLAQKCP